MKIKPKIRLQNGHRVGIVDPMSVLRRLSGPRRRVAWRGLSTSGSQNQQHTKVLVGGTFDRLHDGHRRLLDAARSVPGCCHVVVGVMDDDTVLPDPDKGLACLLEPYEQRADAVRDYVLNGGGGGGAGGRGGVDVRATVGLKCTTVRLHEPYGPSLHGPPGCKGATGVAHADASCLVVSTETAGGGSAVNSKRAALGLQPLALVPVDLVPDAAADDADANPSPSHGCHSAEQQRAQGGGKLSSSELRRRNLGRLLPWSLASRRYFDWPYVHWNTETLKHCALKH